MIYEIHPIRMKPPTTRKKRKPNHNPIADIFPVLDIGAEEINLIMETARTWPVLRAYDSPNGRYIAIAVRKPNKTHWNAIRIEADSIIFDGDQIIA
jgi:hypothetical protein